jgi:hypothetical protein
MSTKKILEELKPEDIVDSFVLPHSLRKKEKAKADVELLEALTRKRAALPDEKKLEYSLLQFKFQLEEYIKSNDYSEKFTFGYFLKIYLNVLNKKANEFAEEIDVPQRSLSKWLNNDTIPDEAIMIRLEIHSNNTIPAVNWLKIIEKGTEYRLISNSALRQIQRAHVKNMVEVTF